MMARQLGVAVMKLAAERSVETPFAAQVDAVLNQPPGHELELHGEAGSDES